MHSPQKTPRTSRGVNSAAKALRALDYLLLVAGAEDLAFLAWWCFMAWCFMA
jgi:hypothetical protein